MKTTGLVIGTLILLIFSSSATAILSSSSTLQGSLNKNTSVFFLGQTSITGTSLGFPMEKIIDSPIVTGMNAFPILGASTIANLDSVIVAEDIDLTTTPSLEELFQIYADQITEYTNVTITTNDGLFLLGIDQGTTRISSKSPYSINTFLPIEITRDYTSRFFITACKVPMTMHCSGNFSVLTGISNRGTLQVQDAQGQILWRGEASNSYIVFHTNAYLVVQQPPLFLFPLDTNSSTGLVTISITPADIEDISIDQLVQNVSSIAQNTMDINTTELVGTFTSLKEFITTTCLVTNGAAILLQTNDTIMIDQTNQRFSNMGFSRFSSLQVNSPGTSGGMTLQGNCYLVFLGNHFYNFQAKNSSNGIAFPFELLFLWITALCVFFSLRFFFRKPIEEHRTDKVKLFTFLLQIVLLIVAIILLDYEVYLQFGISAFTSLFIQGICVISGVFILVELIIWVLGYFLFALPVRILVNSGFRFFGKGKEWNAIGKGIGDLSIWVFCGLYLMLILNVILSFIPFDILFH